jgi:hypothetical protein
MRPVEFHNLKLAAGAQFFNLVPEQLAADPTPLTVPRIWFNTTEGVIKYSKLVTGNPVAIAIGDTSELEAAIADLDTDLRAYVDSEISALGAAFSYRGQVTPGAGAGTAFDLSGLATTEAGHYYKASADGYVTFAADVQFVKAGDGVLFNSAGGYDVIDNSNSEVQGTADEVEVTGSTDTGFTVRLAAAVRTQLANLSSSVSTLLTQIANVKAAVGLDASGNYVVPTTSNYLNASSSVADALGRLDTQLKTVADDNTKVEALRTAINGNVARYESGAANVLHTITHNFGTNNVAVTVWVKDEVSGHYYNDVVSVRNSTDGNSIVIEASEAVNVIVVVEKKEDIAAIA